MSSKPRTRIQTFCELDTADRDAIDTLLDQRRRSVSARRDLVTEGEAPRFVNVVLEGWAGRYAQLSDGRRQLLALLLPGDLCDANTNLLNHMDHSIVAITPLTVAEVDPEALYDLVRRNRRVAHAVWWNDLVSASIQRGWIASLGQRTARERIAHLLCEVYHRLHLIHRCRGDSCEFPLTQADLAEAVGLTPVHVNRMVQDLRRHRLIELSGRSLTLLDPSGLRAVAQFAELNLHFDRARQPG